MASGRNRPLSLSSVEQLSPGHHPAPLFPGAPSCPPASLYESQIIPAPLRSRPSSMEGISIEAEGGRWEERGWSPSMESGIKHQSTSTSNSYHLQSQLSTPSPPMTSYTASAQSSYPNPALLIQTQSSPAPPLNVAALSQVQLQYHQQLITYYLGYARQGRLAPVTDERQERARLEAVARARSEGVVLPDVLQAGGGGGGMVVQSSVQQQFYDDRPRSSSPQVYRNPLPPNPSLVQNTSSVPSYSHSQTSPQIQQYSPQYPLSQQFIPPQEYTSKPSRQPFPPITPIPTSSSQNNISPSFLNRSISLATTPSPPTISTTNLARSSSAVQSPTAYSPVPSSPTKRPLPVPPQRAGTLPIGVGASIESASATNVSRPLPQPGAANITEQMNGLSMENGRMQHNEAAQRRNSVPIPSFSFGDAAPSISIDDRTPTFSISPSTESYPPAFSISVPSSSTSATSIPLGSASHSRLHPRLDPHHPSHYLYHPTSTSSTQKFSAGAIVCARCNVQMFGRALMAMGKEWHPDCFSCSEEGCGVKLEHVQFDGNEEGEVFCMVHYEELYAAQCYQCKTPIAAEEYVTVSDDRLLPPGPRTYHALHFFCSSCGDPFVDPKSLARGKEGTLAAPFMVQKGFAYCQNCDLKMFRPKCAGCKKGIGGDYAEVEGKMWHIECFTCCGCDKPLTGPYLVRDDGTGSEGELPYCYECYEIKAKN